MMNSAVLSIFECAARLAPMKSLIIHLMKSIDDDVLHVEIAPRFMARMCVNSGVAVCERGAS